MWSEESGIKFQTKLELDKNYSIDINWQRATRWLVGKLVSPLNQVNVDICLIIP